MGLDSFEDKYGFLNARLSHLDLLKTPRERLVSLKDVAVFLQVVAPMQRILPRANKRLQNRRCIKSTAARGPRPDESVDFINNKIA